MGRRFQSGDSVVFPTPTILNGTDGGPRTIVVVGKATSAYQALVYSRSSGAHGWWFELDTTGGFHANYGTGTTPRNVGTVGSGAAEIWTGRKDNGGTFSPIGRRFSGASFATDGGDVSPGTTLADGTAIDTTFGIQIGRWGNTGSDYSTDLEIYAVYVWNLLFSGATLAGFTKTHAGFLAGSPDYYISCEGSGTPTDSVGGTPTVTGTTTVSDPSGFFSSGFSAALPVATETSSTVALGRTKSKALPVAVETSSGITFGRSKSGLLVPATEASTGVALGRTKGKALPVAESTDVAVTLGRAKSKALPVAASTDTAQALGRTKSKALPVATETSTAETFGTPDEGLVQALPVAIESSTAPALGRAKGKALPVATEASSAVTLGRTKSKALPVATDTSAALVLSPSKSGEIPPAYEYSTAVTLAGGEPEGSEVMQLGEIMDELATRLRQAPTLAGRTFAYPPATVKAPSAIVTYPTEYTFDHTYGRGMDRIKGEVVVVVGRPTERSSRDRLTRYADGAGPESVKALLDGDDYETCDSVRVESAMFDTFTIGGVDYLAAVFSVDIVGRGAML